MNFNFQNTMKTLRLLPLILLMFSGFAMQAQEDDEPDGKQKEKMEALKKAFITEKLDLTSAEAEKFWPIFNEFDKKKKETRKAIKQAHQAIEKDSSNEKLILEKSDFIAQKKKEEADLEAKLIRDCLPVLGAAKTAKLMGLEEEFKKKLMDELRERRGEGGRPGPPPPHGGRRQ